MNVEIIYLKHRKLRGGLHKMNADVYRKSIVSISREWRPATLAEIKSAGYEVEEVKEEKKKKKTTTKVADK